jgi:hypothetical protein
LYLYFRSIFHSFFNSIFFFTLVIFFQLLGELVPSYIYYHAGSIAVAIRKDIQELFQTTPYLSNGVAAVSFNTNNQFDEHKIHLHWFNYVSLRNLVKEADHIFGSLMLIDYGMKFFMICMMTFSGLNEFRDCPLFEALAPLAMSAIYLLRLVTCVARKSHLFRSRELLQTALITSLNKNWFNLNAEQRKTLSSFQDQVERDQLTANPLGLFSVTPGILLTITSLSVSYIIILIQSD